MLRARVLVHGTNNNNNVFNENNGNRQVETL